MTESLFRYPIICLKTAEGVANSVDSDPMPHALCRDWSGSPLFPGTIRNRMTLKSKEHTHKDENKRHVEVISGQSVRVLRLHESTHEKRTAPAGTQVETMSIQRSWRWVDVVPTLCACWVVCGSQNAHAQSSVLATDMRFHPEAF